MTLEDTRKEIRDIDIQLLSLMKRRLKLAKLVGENKVARTPPSGTFLRRGV